MPLLFLGGQKWMTKFGNIEKLYYICKRKKLKNIKYDKQQD